MPSINVRSVKTLQLGRKSVCVLIMNQQGYIDGLLIGFDGIEPQVLLNVVASSIKVSQITRASL